MSMTATVGPYLPYLRRYARSLTGSQASGDAYVRALLEAMLEGNVTLRQDIPPRIALYRLFLRILVRPPARTGWTTTARASCRRSSSACRPCSRASARHCC